MRSTGEKLKGRETTRSGDGKEMCVNSECILCNSRGSGALYVLLVYAFYIPVFVITSSIKVESEYITSSIKVESEYITMEVIAARCVYLFSASNSNVFEDPCYGSCQQYCSSPS
jgi:hypothetical protein